MAPIVIDLTDVKTEPVAEGWHSVVITQCEVGESSQQHIPQLQFRATIDDESDPDHGRNVYWNCQTQGDGRVFTARCLEALGQNVDEVIELDEADLEAWVGQRLDVLVRHRTYRGRIRANVQDWSPPGEFTDDWAE